MTIDMCLVTVSLPGDRCPRSLWPPPLNRYATFPLGSTAYPASIALLQTCSQRRLIIRPTAEAANPCFVKVGTLTIGHVAAAAYQHRYLRNLQQRAGDVWIIVAAYRPPMSIGLLAVRHPTNETRPKQAEEDQAFYTTLPSPRPRFKYAGPPTAGSQALQTTTCASGPRHCHSTRLARHGRTA